MKKIFTVVLAASMMLFATNAFAQMSVGAGYVNSQQKYKAGGISATTALNGFYVGGAYNINIAGGFGIAPGLYYEFLTRSDKSFLGTTGDTKEHYITLPVMFNYGISIAPSVALRLYTGPSFAYGLSSKTVDHITSVDYTTDNYDSSGYERFDVLYGGGIALDINDRFRINAGYDFGLIDRDGNADDKDSSVHRNQLHVGVAYLF